MTTVRFFSSAIFSLSALLFLFYFCDEWRISRAAKVVLCVFFTVLGPLLCYALPISAAASMPINLVFLLAAGRLFGCARGGRLIFAASSAAMFDYICITSIGLLSMRFHNWQSVCFALAVALLLAFGHAFRMLYLSVYRAVLRGWWLLSLLPLSICAVLHLFLTAPDSIDVHFILAICLFALCCYVVFFRFFRLLAAQHEHMIDTDMLRTQFVELRDEAERHSGFERENQIFRHDMRHYLQILDSCLREQDAAGARGILSTMNDHLAAIEQSRQNGGGRRDI